MPFELFIALRYLVARRKQAFISLISVISTAGVAVGVMALIIALALMTGLQGELRSRIVGASPHIYVLKAGEGLVEPAREVAAIRAVPQVVGASPGVMGKALASSGEQQAFISVKGVDPATEGEVTDVSDRMVAGTMAALTGRSDDSLPGIVIGQQLARSLGVGTGETISLMTPDGPLSPFGPMLGTRRFEVVGIFALGLYEFDAAYGFVDLPTGQRLLGRDAPDFIEVRVDDMYAAPQVADQIVQRLGTSYITQDWAQLNQSLFSALWLEKVAISITIGLIVMVAALNIVASLVLLVMEKSRDIAILKTMGAPARSITWIFMLQGLIIGAIGTTLGALGGVGVSWVLDTYKLIRVPMDVYQVSYVPFTVEWRDFVLVVVAAIVVCFVATIYPSRQASRLDPAQALRYQ
jgi:lipoprotein-releasing system permease protein